MMTLGRFAKEIGTIPTAISLYLSELGEALGKQELFTRQSPQKLKVLREHALIESVVSSNRIEGIEIERSRIGTVLFGKLLFRDRNEEELSGYREALSWIHQDAQVIPVSIETIRELHRLTRGGVGDAGEFKVRDGDIIEKYPNGKERVRFRAVPAGESPAAVEELVGLWRSCVDERWVHPLIGLGRLQPGFPLHPPLQGWERARIEVAAPAPVLSTRLRGRALREHRAFDRAEQGWLLRIAGEKLQRMVRR